MLQIILLIVVLLIVAAIVILKSYPDPNQCKICNRHLAQSEGVIFEHDGEEHLLCDSCFHVLQHAEEFVE